VIILVLVALLGGVALLSRAYNIGATPPGVAGYESVLSELSGAVVGRDWFYYVTIGSIVVVLCLSANTSFADFPRLCHVLAVDRYLPEAFAIRGRRLVYSYGVIVLTIIAGGLLIGFGGVTDHLIPLFAIGAFLAFTMSQSGMIAHWRRCRGPHWRRSMWINGVGAVSTGLTTIVVAASKFTEGAWVAILAVTCLVLLFWCIHRHYTVVAKAVAEGGPLDLSPVHPPIVVVPMETWNQLATRGLRFGLEISPDVHALHVLNDESAEVDLATNWEDRVGAPSRAAGRPVPELVLRKSSFRQFYAPLIEYVDQLRDRHPNRDVVVIVPDLVMRRWYHRFLHNNRGTLLRAMLRLRGGPRVLVVNTPFQLAD
jgi:hypothetical protein